MGVKSASDQMTQNGSKLERASRHYLGGDVRDPF